MAITEKEVKNKWAERLKIEQEKKKAAKEAVDAHKAADLLIGSRKSNLNQPGETGPYKNWDKTHPEHPDYVDPSKIPGEIIQPTIPGLDIETAHHTGGGPGLEGFQEPQSIEAILESIILNETLSDEEKASTIERITGQDPQEVINQFKLRQQQKQSLKIGKPSIA